MNFNNMMKQAQDLQKKMAEAQKKVELLEAEGTSGGGLIKIIIDGKNNVKSVKIDESLISKDDIEILEDLILAAFNDGKEKIQKKITDEMSSITGSLQLPPGFEIVFRRGSGAVKIFLIAIIMR